MNLDCSGVTTEKIELYVESAWDVIKLAVSVNFFTVVTVLVVFYSDKWSKRAVIVFVVIGGIVILSWMRTAGGLALDPLDALLTCIFKCGKRIRQCVVSMTTLFCLMKWNPIMSPVKFFITTKRSAKMWSPMPNLSVAVAIGFSNWPLVTCIWNLGGSSILSILDGAYCLIMSKSFWAIALT